MSPTAENVRTMERILERIASRGVEIREMKNWRKRGSSGTFTPRGGVDHHDASTIKSGEWGALGYIYDRNLSQFVVARCLDGRPKVAVCAAGRSGHAGRGGPFRFIPKDSGNRYMYGVEKANNGLGEPYTEAGLFTAETVLWAIAVECSGDDADMIIGHKEWAPGRKSDPTYSMPWMRQRIRSVNGILIPPTKGDPLMPWVALEQEPDGDGYWMVNHLGHVHTFGPARFHGSLGDVKLHSPIVDMAATPTGGGYWLVGADGGVFAFGDAPYLGSLPELQVVPAAPVTGIEATKTGKGYYLVAADGGVFAFGDARFEGNPLPNVK